jgi:hypothetical protein
MKYLLLIIGTSLLIIGLVIVYKLRYSNKEGFTNSPGEPRSNYLNSIGIPSADQAAFPIPAGNSTIPNTMPGTTTANSSIALAGFKDLSDLLETMGTFNTLYENNISTIGSDMNYSVLYAKALASMAKIKTQIDTKTATDTLDYVTSERKRYNTAINEIHNMPSNSNANNSPPTPLMSLSPGDRVSVSDIQYAISRAQSEQSRIDNLRSSAPDLSSRSQILERVRLALSDIVDKLNNGTLTTDNLPFTKPELTKFLSDVSNPSSTITPIPKPASVQGTRPALGENASGYDISAAFDEISTAAKDLKWDLHIGYDPKVTIQRRLLNQLQQLTSDIKGLSGPELNTKMLELNILQQQIDTYDRRRTAESTAPLEAYTSGPVATVAAPTMLAEGLTQPHPPAAANDLSSRPGYEMTTDAIVHRASNSSYTDTVSGPDYKQRALFLCKQIRGAELGDPKEFGCIANPEHDVAPDYSWRGNYKMVCNRLGNVWGGWYPEMFGCPTSEEAISQAPK